MLCSNGRRPWMPQRPLPNLLLSCLGPPSYSYFSALKQYDTVDLQPLIELCLLDQLDHEGKQVIAQEILLLPKIDAHNFPSLRSSFPPPTLLRATEEMNGHVFSLTQPFSKLPVEGQQIGVDLLFHSQHADLLFRRLWKPLPQSSKSGCPLQAPPSHQHSHC